MIHDLELTAEQLKAAAEWAQAGDFAPVLLASMADDVLAVGQGDERTSFALDGKPLGPTGTAEGEAQLRATCGECLARTYPGRDEDCVCENPDDAPWEDYETALDDELRKRRSRPAVAEADLRGRVIDALRAGHANDSAADQVAYVSDVVGWSAEDDDYEAKVRKLEREGLTRSDAQAAVDAEEIA